MATTGAARATGIALLVAACGNRPPGLEVEPAARAAVGVELVMAIDAADLDGDVVELDFESDLPTIADRARITTDDAGRSTFRWTPLVSDLGAHDFVFRASDRREEVFRETTITVVAAEGQGAPVFVAPLGTGTTLDLAQGGCLEVPVVVVDPDSPGVTLSQVEPLVEGAELVQDSELTATWTFCPTRAQVASGQRFALRLAADDYENPTVYLDWLVVLLGDGGESCPGQRPNVAHTAEDWNTVDDLLVSARVTDAEGLKFAPLLYFAFERPAEPVDVSSMVQLTMALDSGSMTEGRWSARIPNPVAGDDVGEQADVYYVIAASDNDDLEGSCDHTTIAPDGDPFSATVTNPGGSGDRALCEPCTADAQCGGPDDLCVVLAGEPRCFLDCARDADCPDDTYCSFSEFVSVDGHSGHQCVPDTLTCEAADPVCDDDDAEPNDGLLSATPLSEGNHDLVSCTLDEDWYQVSTTEEGDLDVLLDGGNASDLDLALYDWWGVLVDVSDDLSSFEAVTACVPPGDWLVRVLAYGEADNDYVLDVDHVRRDCAFVCDDDAAEPDDGRSTARPTNLDLGVHRDDDQQICPLDEDWYEVFVYEGEELWVSIDFQQDAPDGDLDLILRGTNGDLIVGCTEADPEACDANNGQSSTSNETMGLVINVTDTYEVVVRGWDGASNAYDVCIGLSRFDCP